MLEKEMLRYMISTLSPILVIGVGWLVLKGLHKKEGKNTFLDTEVQKHETDDKR